MSLNVRLHVCFSSILQAAPEWKPFLGVAGATGLLHGPGNDPEQQEKDNAEYKEKYEKWEKTRAEKIGTAPAQGTKRGEIEVSTTERASVEATVYLGHVWSRAEFYREYDKEEPPKGSLGNHRISEGYYKYGFLLDKQFYSPSAGMPKIMRRWSEMADRKKKKAPVLSKITRANLTIPSRCWGTVAP